jgi:hypothetical protein
MKTGVPPTARKARTGEFTPEGMCLWASLNNFLEFTAGNGLERYFSRKGILTGVLFLIPPIP